MNIGGHEEDRFLGHTYKNDGSAYQRDHILETSFELMLLLPLLLLLLTTLHNKELHNLYFPPTIFRVIKSRRITGWTGSTQERKEICIQNFIRKTLRYDTHARH
jgi:hypothetical protein